MVIALKDFEEINESEMLMLNGGGGLEVLGAFCGIVLIAATPIACIAGAGLICFGTGAVALGAVIKITQ